jgi:hypothetical protein
MSAIRPTGGFALIAWASGTSGAGAITEPTQLQKNMGWQSNTSPPASYFNAQQHGNYQWISYFNEAKRDQFCGDGSAGSLTVNTSYSATCAHQYQDLAIGPSGIYFTDGWPIFIRGALTGVSGIIHCDGYAGFSAPTGGDQVRTSLQHAGPLSGGRGGGTGSTGGGESTFNSLGGRGGSGGLNVGSAFMGGHATGPIWPYKIPPTIPHGIVMGPTPLPLRGGAGGGEGSPGGGAGMGGGGGGGAGVVLVTAAEVNFSGIIRARGGTGGVGWNGGGIGGAGGGGGGGGAIFAYLNKVKFSGTFDFRGGPPHPTGTQGAMTGHTGMTGIIEIQL